MKATSVLAGRRRRWGIFVAAFAGVILTAVLAYQGALSNTRPNILVVTFDTTRADHLGTYGYKEGLTQAFDEFASGGVVFERAYTPAPITLPSHASILTGLYPPEHDLRSNGVGHLSGEIPFLPSILKDNGYDTGAFVAIATVLGQEFGLDRGFDTYDDAPPSPSYGPRPYADDRRDGREVVDHALEWLKEKSDDPFFCWVHLYDAHAPFQARPTVFHDQFQNSPYDAGIAWEVRQFNRLITYLKEQELDSNTVVIVAGDHGEGLGEHGETEHGMMIYDSTLHVPLVFVGPGYCKPATRVSGVVSLVDLMPTVLEMLGITIPESVSGRSLVPALNGNEIDDVDCYAEAEMPYAMNRWSPLQAVISGSWKYIRSRRSELYDLQKDPGELTNLLEIEPEKSQRLKSQLVGMEKSFSHFSAEDVDLSEQTLANLKSLGYVSGSTSTVSSDLAGRDEELEDVKDMISFYSEFEDAKRVAGDGDMDKAIAMLQQVAWATDEFPMSDLMLGDFLTQEGRQEEAEAVYFSVLDRRSDYIRAHVNLGRIMADQGRLKQAALHFKEFVAANPQDASGHLGLAGVLARLKQLDEAAKEYREVLRLAPSHVGATVSLSRLLLALKRPHEAVVVLENALTHDKTNLMVHENLMMVYAQQGQLDKAILYGQRGTVLSPRSFEIRFNLGLMLIGARRYSEGILELREAKRIRPEDPRPEQQIKLAEVAMSKGAP